MHPEDVKSEALNKIAISLTFQNSEDKDSTMSFSIPREWFFDGETTKHNKESIFFGDDANVEIIYKNRTLLIEADGAIDVSIESSIPAHALIIKTAGNCNINAVIGLHDSITIEAKDIVFNANTASDRLTLLSNKDTINTIKINESVTTNSLNATANELIISATLDAKTRILDCNKISIEKTGIFTPIGFPNPRYEKERSNKMAYIAPVDTKSKIDINYLENHGRFESNDGTIIVRKLITLAERSVTKFNNDKLVFAEMLFDGDATLEANDTYIGWTETKGENTSQLALEGAVKLTKTIVEHPNVTFGKKCKAYLSKTKIISKDIIILNEEPIKGDNVEMYAKNQLSTYGDCDINNLVVNANKAKIRSVLDGNDFTSFKVDNNAEVHGLIYGKNTVYQGNFLLLTPLTYDWSMTDQRTYKYCRKKGGLVGTESLTINTLALVRVAGGYIYGRNLNVRTGVNINIVGLSYADNYNFQSVLPSIELGFDLPWLPNSLHDLVNINKILSLSYRIILTFGKAEYAGVASALMLAAAAGPTVVQGVRSIGSSIYEDPNPLNHLKYTKDVGIALAEKVARRAKQLGAYGYNTVSSKDGMTAGVHDMQKTIVEYCNSTKLLDIVTSLLNAKGMYIAGNSIFYHATNFVKFTTDLQQGTLPPLNIQDAVWKLSDNVHDYGVATNLENQLNSYNDGLFKFLGKELFIFLGPSVYKSTMTVAVDFNLIISGTVVQDSLILSENTNVYAFNSASSAMLYYNRGNYHGAYRTESAVYRYDSGKYNTQSLQVNATYNTVYGKFNPTGKLVFNVTNNHVAPGAEFRPPSDTRGFVTADFINEGKVVISGGAFKINGKFHVKSTGTANINNAYFQDDKLIVEGKYNASNSNITESEQHIASGAEYTISKSKHQGNSITWEKGAKVNVAGSEMYGSTLNDLGAPVTTNNAYFKMKCIFRNGHWQVSDVLIFDSENIQTTLQSTLNGAEISHVETHADHADLQGSEDVQYSVVDVKDMSASEILEYVDKTGRHANKTIRQQLVMQTASNEPIELNSFERGDIGVAIVTPGTITQNAPYHGRSLGLHSTENSVHLNNDVSAELDVNIFAKKNIFKPGVVVESFKGNVQLIAEEGILNNDNGGQILSHNGNTTAVGAQFSNNTNGAARMSTVSGDKVIAQSTQGTFDVFRGLLKAKTVLEIYSAADFNLQPEVIRQWLSKHEMGNVYYGSVLQGGTGTEENGGVGLILRVEGKFDGAASSINSVGKNLIFVNKDIHGETKVTVYKSVDDKEKHGFFRNRHYLTAQAAKEFRMEILSEDQNIIHSLEGKVQLEGVQTFAPNGTETSSAQEMIARPVPYILHNTHNKNRHVHESTHSSRSEQEAMTMYAHTTGITSFTSDKFIYHNGVIYLGLPGSEFRFAAPDGITLTSNILNHSSTSTSVSAQLALFGQTLTGSDRKLNPMNTFYYLDPTGGSIGDFAHSSSIPEAFVNGASSIYGMSNMLGSIAQNGLMGTLTSQMGASLILSRTKTIFGYQTEGGGGFYGGANISMQTDGIVTFAVNVHDKIAIFSVMADELRIFNTALNSRFTSESVSIAPSIMLNGSYDVGLSLSHQSYRATTQVQRNLSIGTFNLNVRHMHNRGVDIVCNKINGKADTIENENTINTNSSTQTQVSASLQGNVSGNHVHATEQTEGAKASILVTDGINNDPEYNLEVNVVINHGDADISTANPETNRLLDQGTQVVHIDQTLKSKRLGGGFSSNISDNDKKPLPKLSVDLLNQLNTVNENGLVMTKESKFKANVPMPMPRFTPPVEEPLINLGETNESNALSGRQPSIIGPALEQVESNDFLTDPGYRHGRPSSAVGDTEVQQSRESVVGHAGNINKTPLKEVKNDLPYVPDDSGYIDYLHDWTSDNSYTEDSIKRSIAEFLSDPVNRAYRGDRDQSTNNVAFSLPSALPASSDNRTLAYIYAMGRGIEQARDSVTNAVIHPINTVEGLGTTIWDGLNVISEETLGITTQAAKLRNELRGRLVNDAVQRFKDGDGIVRTQMASKIVTEYILGSAITRPIGPITSLATDSVAGQYLLTQYGLKRTTKFMSNGQANVEQANMLRGRYAIEEIFTRDGRLTENAIARAMASGIIQEVSEYSCNSPVYKLLVNQGNISDWGKYKIKVDTKLQIEINGNLYPLRGQVHVYMNSVTKKVFYDRDFKIKLDTPGNPVLKIDDVLNQTLRARGKYDCKM